MKERVASFLVPVLTAVVLLYQVVTDLWHNMLFDWPFYIGPRRGGIRRRQPRLPVDSGTMLVVPVDPENRPSADGNPRYGRQSALVRGWHTPAA